MSVRFLSFVLSMMEPATYPVRAFVRLHDELETYGAFDVPLPDLPTGTCAAGTIPVYRLWNNRIDTNHRYTTDVTIKQQMIARGYIAEGFGPEGVAMCAVAPYP